MSASLKIIIENFIFFLEEKGDTPHMAFNITNNAVSKDVIVASESLKACAVKNGAVNMLTINASGAATENKMMVTEEAIVIPMRINGMPEEFGMPLHRLMAIFSREEPEIFLSLNPKQVPKEVFKEDKLFLEKMNAMQPEITKKIDGNVVQGNFNKKVD